MNIRQEVISAAFGDESGFDDAMRYLYTLDREEQNEIDGAWLGEVMSATDRVKALNLKQRLAWLYDRLEDLEIPCDDIDMICCICLKIKLKGSLFDKSND